MTCMSRTHARLHAGSDLDPGLFSKRELASYLMHHDGSLLALDVQPSAAKMMPWSINRWNPISRPAQIWPRRCIVGLEERKKIQPRVLFVVRSGVLPKEPTSEAIWSGKMNWYAGEDFCSYSFIRWLGRWTWAK